PEEIKNWVIEQYGVNAYYLPEGKIKELIAKNKPKVLTDRYAPVENLLAPMVSLTEETPYFRRLGYAIKETELGQVDKGIEEIIKIVNERPNFNEAYLVLAETLIEANRFAEAVTWAKKLIQQVPQEVKGYVVLGTAYAHLGDTASAIAVWEKALKMDPNLLNIKINLSSLLIQQNQFDRAEQLLKEVQGKDTSLDTAVLSNLASLYFSQGKLEWSLKELLKLEQLQPQNYFVKEQIAIVYHRLGNIEKARELVQECQKANHPVNPEFLRIIEQGIKQ
ncbi:MAG TPA: tetratricopeptide repeat protein, partial [Candidatus Hydrogenedens sp.]|nr:tetratricopeptide repeat protein [Candidatus Hydrogenedens sp.]